MERIQIVIALFSILTLGCNQKVEDDAKSNSLNNSIHSILHMNRTLNEMRDFVGENHLKDECSNELLIRLVDLHDYINDVKIALTNKSGGITKDGDLINMNNETIHMEFLEEIKFVSSLNEKLRLIEISNAPFSEKVFKNIMDNVRPLKSSSYENSTLANVLVDLVVVRSNLLNTEVQYFEVLKSNFDCNSNSSV